MKLQYGVYNCYYYYYYYYYYFFHCGVYTFLFLLLCFYKSLKVDLNLLQAAEHLDDEEVEDEETALENFTTSVDNEETDEFIAFRTSIQGITTSASFSE